VSQVLGFNSESEPNNTRETATPLPMNSTQPDLISGAGRGFLADGSDWDYWSFEAQAGDKLILAAETPGNLPARDCITPSITRQGAATRGLCG